MTPATGLLLFNLILATVAMCGVRRRPAGEARKLGASTKGGPAGLDAFIRSLRTGNHVLAEHAAVRVLLTPTHASAAAVEVASTATNTKVVIPLEEVRAVRGWINGRLSFAVGDQSLHGAPLRPLSKSIAGWELEVITASDGGGLRCYGEHETNVQAHFLRLRRQLGFRPGACTWTRDVAPPLTNGQTRGSCPHVLVTGALRGSKVPTKGPI